MKTEAQKLAQLKYKKTDKGRAALKQAKAKYKNRQKQLIQKAKPLEQLSDNEIINHINNKPSLQELIVQRISNKGLWKILGVLK